MNNLKEYKNPFCIRKTHLNCPLPLTLESYWACEADCFHCLGRNLNKIWGEEQRIANPEQICKKLTDSQRSKDPKSPLAIALKKKKAIFLGRKADPYQSIENQHKVTRNSVKVLIDLSWPFVICSRYISNALRDTGLFVKTKKDCFCFLIEITAGCESDWEIFERKRTSPIKDRLMIGKEWLRLGLNVGIRGEPFIPGYHTVSQFKDILKLIKSYGFMSYNIYNLHLNPYTAKRLLDIGLDIEKIWDANQDKKWKPVQKELCEIADKENINLGCPDFVNLPKNWVSNLNTCCGIDIKNAFKFNTHNWRKLLQEGLDRKTILETTWEGIGTKEDLKNAELIMCGKSKNHYTMKDSGL